MLRCHMKRIRSIIILFILIILSSFEVSAKDTVHTLNKYTKESLDIIIKGYAFGTLCRLRKQQKQRERL